MRKRKLSAAKLAADALALAVGSFLSAFALHSFIIPNGFVSGGVGGISAILENAGMIKSYISYYLFNIPLLIAAVIKLKKDFAVKTVISATLVTVIMGLMESSGFLRFTGDRLLAAIYSGVLFGISLGMVYEAGGSTGGSEIIANLITKRRPEAKVSVLILAMDVIIIAFGLLVFDGWSVIYALVCSVVCEKIMAVYLDKGRMGDMYYIVTERPEGILAALNNRFGREGIAVEARGSTSDAPKTLIKLFLPNGKQHKVKQTLAAEDGGAFAFVAGAAISSKGNRVK
jgi:uncharacterized membrane-anchored protein YitT (DUF2179 family)